MSNDEFETRLINAKIFHVFGPGDSKEKFVPQMFRQCYEGNRIDLTDGMQKRDFIYSSDVVEAYWVLMKSIDRIALGYSEFEIGRGEPVSIKDFIVRIHGVCKSKASLNFGALEKRKDEMPCVVADVSSLEKIGWSPEVSITKGLEIIHNNCIKEN